MIGWLTEWHRQRELKKYFKVRFFRERHEIYLRIVAFIETAGDKTLAGVTLYSLLFEVPNSLQVDMRLTSRMLQALRADGLIEATTVPAPTDPRWMAALHARYRLTRQGTWFLDEWWVKRTLQGILGSGPNPAPFIIVSEP